MKIPGYLLCACSVCTVTTDKNKPVYNKQVLPCHPARISLPPNQNTVTYARGISDDCDPTDSSGHGSVRRGVCGAILPELEKVTASEGNGILRTVFTRRVTRKTCGVVCPSGGFWDQSRRLTAARFQTARSVGAPNPTGFLKFRRIHNCDGSGVATVLISGARDPDDPSSLLPVAQSVLLYCTLDA